MSPELTTLVINITRDLEIHVKGIGRADNSGFPGIEENRSVFGNRCVHDLMRLTDDLTDRRAILLKGWLFLVLGLMAAGSLLALAFSWQVAMLLAISLWAFCRWYYFMFYVIEHYVDPSYKFAGLGSFLRYLKESRK